MSLTCHRELACDLVPGEERLEIFRPDAALSVGFIPCTGEVTGVLVLIHGVASNASRWEEFVEFTTLRSHWHLIRLDLRAHGASSTTSVATLEKHADDLVAVLDHLKMERAVWVGHSLGAQIAMMSAMRHPMRTAGLVLLDPLVSGTLTRRALVMKRWRPLVRILEVWGRMLQAIGWRRRLPKYSLRRHDEEARKMLLKGGEEFRAFVREYSSPWSDLRHIHLAPYMRDLLEVCRQTPAVEAFQMPSLVVASQHGAFTDPEKVVAWVERMPRGAVTTVACVHWPLTECPMDVSQAIEEWLERIFPQAT